MEYHPRWIRDTKFHKVQYDVFYLKEYTLDFRPILYINGLLLSILSLSMILPMLADIYFGRAEEVKSRREEIKQATLGKRRRWHRQGSQDRLYWESESPLNLNPKMSH